MDLIKESPAFCRHNALKSMHNMMFLSCIIERQNTTHLPASLAVTVEPLSMCAAIPGNTKEGRDKNDWHHRKHRWLLFI